ncbi:hypothetical protein G7046_g1607 [Stylonectria norvegica]|nr:hypothetical protein G7046_g1607 [Stylonectria norvegica]
MAQPATTKTNGVPGAETPADAQIVVSGKRKRDSSDDDAEDHEVEGDDDGQTPSTTNGVPKRDEKELIQSYFDVLSSFDISPPILKRSLQEPSTEDEPQTKRQKSAELGVSSTISDKVANNAYAHLEDLKADVVSAAQASLAESKSASSEASNTAQNKIAMERIAEFKEKALQLLRREKAYPRIASEPLSVEDGGQESPQKGEVVLSLIGYAPQERRLFSSLPLSHDVDLDDISLPQGMSLTQVVPSMPQERTQTLGDLFASPRTLPPLQPPKQPKTQAKGNNLDFYHPELTDKSKYRSNSYFTTKLSAGYYLDYSNATPSSQIKTKQRERAQSLAGKKPSTIELEMSEMESLFRGAFSSFAPCKDDSAAVIPSSVAARMWWQRNGQRNFQNLIEVEYYEEADEEATGSIQTQQELDEAAIQDAIENWDDDAIDPSLDDIMGTKRDDQEKEVNEILEEVTDLIETLSSYQRIRNLTLPNSTNRQSSDPVTGDMLANAGPQPSEEEQATYQVLKAQLALIIKTLPPFAVAKLNGDQLEDLLISTKVQVQTDQYKGVMEEDEAAVQARIRSQQAAAQANIRPSAQRTPSISAVPYANQYTPGNQYGTPNRTPALPQQYYRPGVTPSYPPQQRAMPPAQPRPPQPNQYTRPNGYPNQYATQLAKAQTPYGHQSMPQYASQQRPPYGQLPAQQATPNPRFSYQSGFPQQPGTPSQGAYGAYTNGSAVPPRTMSPQVQQRQQYSASPNVQHTQRYVATPQGMNSQINRFPSNPGQTGTPQTPGLTGYHTVIPEAQQQRILDQAKARVAAQERSAMFADKITQPGMGGLSGMGLGSGVDASRLAAARASMAAQQKPQTPLGNNPRIGLNGTPGQHIPHKVTPVPVPAIPGLRKSST